MAVLRFRIYYEEDESVYRDIVILHTQTFKDLHDTILKSFEFDNKHQATFYRSNDQWQQGREITLAVYEKPYKAPPLLMAETQIGSEIKITNQKFIYLYDFNKQWTFLVELINISKEVSSKIAYPSAVRVEGLSPSQYGTRGLLGERFADVEEKYDLVSGAEGFGQKDEEGEDTEAEQELEEDEGEE